MGQRSSNNYWSYLALCALVVGSVIATKALIHKPANKVAPVETISPESIGPTQSLQLASGQTKPSTSNSQNENAAPLYHQAADLVSQVIGRGELWNKIDSGGLDTPEKLQAARQIVPQLKPALSLLAEAAKRTTCDIRSKPSDLSASFPELAKFKLLAKAVQVSARFEAANGRPVQASNDLAIYAPMCGHIAQTHSMIAGLVQVAVEALFTRTISDLLAQHGNTSDVGASAARVLNAMGPTPSLPLMAETENVQKLSFLDPKNYPASVNYKPDPTDDAKTQRMLKLARQPGMIAKWRVAETDSSHQFEALFKSAGDDWLALEKSAEELSTKLAASNDDAHAWQTAAGGPPDWRTTIDILAREISNRRVLAQAAAILSTANDNARPRVHIPKQLPLTGLAAIDPLGSGPLHYIHTAGGFTIYAVGKFGVDHGGKQRQPGSAAADYDEVFTYSATSANLPIGALDNPR